MRIKNNIIEKQYYRAIYILLYENIKKYIKNKVINSLLFIPLYKLIKISILQKKI